MFTATGAATFSSGVTVQGNLGVFGGATLNTVSASGAVQLNGATSFNSNVNFGAGATISVNSGATVNVPGTMTVGNLTATTCNCANFGSTSGGPIYSAQPVSRTTVTLTNTCNVYLNDHLTVPVPGSNPVRYRFVFRDMVSVTSGGPTGIFTFISTTDVPCSAISSRVGAANYQPSTASSWVTTTGEFYLTLNPGINNFYYHVQADSSTNLPVKMEFANSSGDQRRFGYFFATPA
eukprot:TRINITY_DN1469_c0_g1_i2.p1 TRINITY_DN1469_c0_g1~~TRINITY_DN1469_c0_g1_i2.p1  ORF type:complete len:235 (+),score=79.25 TRINITY_DN1469_c0_g1_i2:247-951(+)